MNERDNTPEGTVDDEDLYAQADGLNDEAITEIEDSDEEQPDDRAEGQDENEGEPEDEAEEAETEEEPEAEAAEEKAKPAEQPARIRLKDGSEVTLDEVDAGFLRQSDYTRKTQEVARERAAIEGDRAHLTQYAHHAKATLDLAIDALGKVLPRKPDPAMIQTDALGYMQAQAVYEAGVEQLDQLVAARRQAEGQEQEQRKGLTRQQQADLGKAIEREGQLLVQKAPELRSEAARSQMLREASDLGAKHYDLKADEVGAIQDHRFILILKDAIAYRKLQDAKPAAIAKVKAAPPIRPAVRQAPGTRAAQRDNKAWARLQREGTPEAAADALPDSLFD